jgi:hypothetical protein
LHPQLVEVGVLGGGSDAVVGRLLSHALTLPPGGEHGVARIGVGFAIPSPEGNLRIEPGTLKFREIDLTGSILNLKLDTARLNLSRT